MSVEEAILGGVLPPPLCEYAAQVTAERLDRMLSHGEGVRKGEDPHHVHQMRVWSRRSRAALEIFQVCFAGKAFLELEREVKATADALGEARDLDVMIDNLAARAAKLPASQRGGVESFADRLRAQRESRQEAVAAAVSSLESHDLAQRFRDLARQEEAIRSGQEDERGKSQRKGKRVRKNG